MTTSPPTWLDRERILRETFVRHVELHDELGSTNDRALVLAADGARATPLLVVARRQIAGRGRGAARWWAAEGALTFSLIIEPGEAALASRHWPQIALAAAVAVCGTIEGLHPQLRPLIKWPNDVHCQGRKLSGMLIEVPAGRPGTPRRVVLGVGLNVANSWRSAPEELRAVGTALCDLTDAQHALDDVLVLLLQELEQRIAQLAQGDPRLADAWQARSLLTGRHVAVEQGNRSTAGLCEGIDHEGALLLRTGQSVERIFGGTVRTM